MICNYNKKKWISLGIVFLPVLTLCLEAALLLLHRAFPGGENHSSSSLSFMPLSFMLIHWFLTCCLWGISAWGICLLSRKNGFDPLKERARPGRRERPWLLLIIAAGILFMTVTNDFRFKPFKELAHFLSQYGAGGFLAFVFQHIYYLFECVLISLIVALGDQAGLALFKNKQLQKLPWGGIFCAATWGALHGISKDWETAFLCISLSLLFDAAYRFSKKNLRYAYVAAALIFLL